MAELCRECYFKMYPKEQLIPVLSAPWDKDLCEGCGKWKRVVITLRPPLFAGISSRDSIDKKRKGK